MNLTLGVAPRAFPPWKMPGYHHSLHDNVSWLRMTVRSITHLLYACYLYKEKHAIRSLLSPIPASRTNKYIGNAPLACLLVQVVLDIRTIRSLIKSRWLSWVSWCIGHRTILTHSTTVGVIPGNSLAKSALALAQWGHQLFENMATLLPEMVDYHIISRWSNQNIQTAKTYIYIFLNSHGSTLKSGGFRGGGGSCWGKQSCWRWKSRGDGGIKTRKHINEIWSI